VIGKPELDAWKQRELLATAVSTGRRPGQTDEEYAQEIVNLYDVKQGLAAKRGTAIHDELEAWITWKRQWDFSKEAAAAKICLDEHDMQLPICEESFAYICANGRGFGGRIDLQCFLDCDPAIVDFKTQTVKTDSKGKPKPTIYDEMGMQLWAYREGSKQFPAMRKAACYNLIIATNMDYVYLHKWDETELDRCGKMFYSAMELFYLGKRL
jgi:hypothetical protein